MALDRSAPHLAPLRALLREDQWRRFEQLVEVGTLGNIEVDGVHTHLKALHLSESDRQVLAMAYALWRGFGVGIEVHSLWGMDRSVARRMLAAMASAVDPQAGSLLLQEAAQLLPDDASQQAQDNHVSPVVALQSK